MPIADMLQSGQFLAARYTLLRKLGEGRVAQVWQARDREDGGDRVLKILTTTSGAEREQFLASARLQRQLRHPRLQSCTTVHEGEPAFAVFADVASGDLAAWRGRPWTVLLPALADIADGLAAMHASGLVHRDLKPANVLIDAEGRAMLADFGLAAGVGDPAAAGGGSPFSMSPQQRDGAAPAIADDIYGFGALAYELLSGYPPLYPDPERARHEPPAALRPGLVPAALESLVMRCLAKLPADRPKDMSEVARSLRSLELGSASREPTRTAARPVALKPPADAEPAIAPQWTRTNEQGPSPGQLRAQGFRRGLLVAGFVVLLLGAGFVFLLLPRWVERNAAGDPPAPPVVESKSSLQEVPKPDAVKDLERLALARRDFESLRPSAAQRLGSLESRAAGVWGGEGFARGKRLLADADAAFGRREYVEALATLRAADADLVSTEKLAVVKLREALAAGAAGLESGDAAAARAGFERALQIEASNAVAKRGLERATTLDEVRALLAEARMLEERGDTTGATAEYRKALALDRDALDAREGIARLQAQASSAEFAGAMSQGLDALARRDYAAARESFERAGRLRPGSPEVADAIAQVERALGARSLAANVEAAQAAEREERWADALTEYRKALTADPNLLAAQQGVERAEPRAQLDAELRAYAERPERLYSPDMRNAARAAITRARAVPQAGPVLRGQIAAVESLVTAAETPQRVALTSDNQTDVTVYRVGRLGTFERKDVELLPGRYTVVGQRAGYRDVRREITLLPGRDAPTVVIRCEEPI
jgi:tetratricopeptide (TPR) repeat protein